MAGVEVDPILTVGDTVSGYRFEALPDGIALRTRGQGRVDVFVNHETSKVPFPYNTAAPTAANGENDFDNSQVSRLVLNRKSGGVLSGSYVVPSSAGFQRFCSSYLATAAEGFDRDILFTNEEGIDYVRRPRTRGRWPSAAPRRSRSASSWRWTSGPGSTTRSTGWAATTTRTASR